jgi:hypothetical protein
MCPVRAELETRFAAAVAELTILTNQQLLAIVIDRSSQSVDDLVGAADEKRKMTLDALRRHLKEHGC